MERPKTRKFTTLQSVSIGTLMKYMEFLNQIVLEKLKVYVPNNGVYLKFDYWSCDDEHYTAVNLSLSVDKGKKHKCTLFCGVLDLIEDMKMVESVEDDEEDSGDNETRDYRFVPRTIANVSSTTLIISVNRDLASMCSDPTMHQHAEGLQG